MKSFIWRLILFALPVVVVLILVNYYGDAANLFSGMYESSIAKQIVKGNNVTNIQNCDERLLQKEIINGIDYCPSTIVLGSSRVMEIREDNMSSNNRFLNNGVSGGTIEDIIAIVQLYQKKQCLPKRVIIGLDPWILNRNNEQQRWRTLSKEYNQMLRVIGLPDFAQRKQGFLQQAKMSLKDLLKYYQLVSPSYFQNSIKSIVLNNKKIKIVNDKVNNTFTKLSDGSVTYDSAYRNATSEIINKRVATFTSIGGMYSIENFDKLDEQNEIQLTHLIKYLVDRNVIVDILLAPYHPVVYNKIIQTSRYLKVIEAEKKFKEIAEQFNIRIVGSYDPKKILQERISFYDGMHCNDVTINNIVSEYKTTPRVVIF